MNTIDSLSGYPAYTGADALKYIQLVSVLSDQIQLLGFKPLVLPSIARKSLFTRSVGEVSDIVTKEMTCLANDDLCLRPEGTALAMTSWFNQASNRNPVKWFYSGSMFRSERPQEGRLREFRQFGVEAIGLPFGTIDAEMVSVCSDIFSRLNIETVLKVNTIGSNTERERYSSELRSYLNPYRPQLSALEVSRLDNSPLRLFDSPSTELQAVLENAPRLMKCLSDDSIKQYQIFLSDLDTLGVCYSRDESLVRGLDYYTGPVYEWQAKLPGGRTVAIAAGGRYDGLAGMLTGTEVPAVGMAFGLDRMMLLLNEFDTSRSGSQSCWQKEDGRKVALWWSQKQRMAGAVAWTDNNGGKWNKQMSRADKSDARFAAFFGEEELLNNRVSIKDLETGIQTSY